MGYMVQKFIVEDAKKASPLMPQHIALVDPKGKPVELGGGAPGAGSIDAAKLAANAVETAKIKDGAVTKAKLAGGVLPANATKEAPGLVKQAAKVDDCADNNADHLKSTLNGLLASLRAAGVLATS